MPSLMDATTHICRAWFVEKGAPIDHWFGGIGFDVTGYLCVSGCQFRGEKS